MPTPDPLSPPRFSPQRATLSGPAFGAVFRLIATALMALITLWGYKLLGDQHTTGQIDKNIIGLALLAFAMLLYMWWTMMRSTTTLTADHLSQTWFWTKRSAIGQISYAKFMRLRGLEWLIAPRLYVRTGPGPFVSYHAATPQLWDEFEAMAKTLSR